MKIQNKIFTLVAGLVLSIIVTFAIAFFSYRLIAEKNELTIARNHFFKSFKSFEIFTNTSDLHYKISFDSTYKNLSNIIHENRFMSGNGLQSSLENFDSLFQIYAELYKVQGLNENSGLEGKFRDAIHDVGDAFKAVNNPLLLSVQLEIRRREKDFLLRGDQIYATKVKNELKNLSALVSKNKQIRADLKTQIQAKLEQYEKSFFNIVTVKNKIASLRKKISENVQNIEEEFQNTNKKVDSYAENYLLQMLIIFSISFTSTLIFAIVVSRSIIRPLNALKNDVSNIDVKNIDSNLSIDKNDEIGDLSRSFSNMLGRLQAAYKEIDLAKLELEGKVIERTKELKEEIEEKKKYEEKLVDAFDKIHLIKERLKVSLDKEIELNKIKSNFVKMISYEYRTPLTIILTNTYLLEKYFEIQDSKNFKKQLATMTRSAEKMIKLIDDTSLLPSIGNSSNGYNNLSEESRELELVSFVEEIVGQRNRDLSERQVKVTSIEKIVILVTDPLKLQKSIICLLDNALKYSRKNDPVGILINKTQIGVEILIKDRGIGVPDHEKAEIFQPFYRASNINGTPGTGMGLSIAKELVNNLNGDISFESKIQEGSTFKIELN